MNILLTTETQRAQSELISCPIGRRRSGKKTQPSGQVLYQQLTDTDNREFAKKRLHRASVVLSVHNRNGGFTLLEIVIAIAILAIVFSSLYAAYSNTLETTEQVEIERDIEQAARLGLMRMADDLASVYVQEVENESEDSPYRFVGGSSDSLGQGETVVEFATSGQLDFDMIFPSLRINRVSYVLERQTENERYYRLVRREIPFVGLGGEGYEAEIEVADGVEQLTLTYVGEEGEVASQWDSQAPETEGLVPRLIHIRLQMAEDKSRFFTTTVALPAISNNQSTPGGRE